MDFDGRLFLWAVALGGLSAVSLLLGSAIGLVTRPRERVVAAFGAFGAGALLAALAVELVAPTLAELEMHAEGHSSGSGPLLALIAGAVMGGLVFVALDRALSERGAFLRKTGTAIAQFRRTRRARRRAFVEELCESSFLRLLPAECVAQLAEHAEPVDLADAEVLFRAGDPAGRMFVVRNGTLELVQGEKSVERLGAGQVVGELSLITGAPRAVGARASGVTSVLAIPDECIQPLCAAYPEFDEALRALAGGRLEAFQSAREQSREERDRWTRDALAPLRGGGPLPSAADLQAARSEHGGAGLAVWLGILLDGIPESIVIGASFAALAAAQAMQGAEPTFGSLVPYTLIAGLFLSNLPEAMSSSVAMRTQGFRPGRILLLWGSLVVVTALGAGAGYAVSDSLPALLIAGIEGLAAGAMLTAIASTMIPEAVHLASSHAVGLSTLAGFLSAIAFKLLE